MNTFFFDLSLLEERRKALKMPLNALAKRSGVSRSTAYRILRDRDEEASFKSIAAVANALGLAPNFEPVAEAEEFRFQEATRKARSLVGQVQATMGLEASAIDSSNLNRLIDKTAFQLLDGPKRKLW